MFRKLVSVLTAVTLVISLTAPVFTQRAFAYQNNSYFSNIRVGLVSMSSATEAITLNGEYTVNGQASPSGTVLNLAVSGTGISMNGALYNEIDLTPSDSTNLLTLSNGSSTYSYMGSFILKVYNGNILPINIIDIENYLKGVVGYEMSDYFPIEALKAQAVAARNYALADIGSESSKGYDLDDTIRYQVYKGFNASYKNVIAAVDATRGQVLLYNNTLINALYSAWNGGYSENSENVWGNYVPYLRSAQDTYESDPWPNGNRTFTSPQIQSTLVSKGYLSSADTFLKLDLNSITKYPSGRVSNINVIYKDAYGITNTLSITMDKARTFLSLPSSMYNVTYDPTSDVYTFSGKGYGHGLGMSQIGAKNRAAAGQTYDQILSFYYQNTYIQNLILKASITGFTQSESSLFLGDSISFNTTAGAGNGYGYLYKYVIKNDGNTVFTRDYSSDPTLDYTPSSSGSYTVDSYVKDKYSVSDYDDTKESTFTVYPAESLNSLSVDKTETLTGQGVTVSPDVTGGSGSYLYKYEVSQNGSVIMTRDYLPDKQFVFTPQSEGNYTITAYIKDAVSTKDYDIMQSAGITAYPSLALASFNKDKDNINVGDTVNFAVQTSGGSDKGISYMYSVSKDGSTIMKTDYSADSQFTYVPDSAGSYEVSVYAKDAVSSQQYDIVGNIDFTVAASAGITSFTADKSSMLVNDTVTFNTAGNDEGALYKFVVMKDNNTVFTRDYSSGNTFQYTPDTSGNYTVLAYAKDQSSTKDYDDMKSLSITVYDNAQLGSFSEDKTQALVNQQINFTANADKGSGSYLYKFAVSKDNNILASQDYSQAGTFSYIPAASGSYSVNVYVKDSLSSKDYDDSKVLNFTVYDTPAISMTGTTSQTLVGNEADYAINAQGGSGSYQYRFVVMKDSNTVFDGSYADSNTFGFSPSEAGQYKIYGYVLDTPLNTVTETQNTLTLDVDAPAALSSAAVDKSQVVPGESFTVNAQASGQALYKYAVSKDNSVISTQDYSSNQSFTFTPADAGQYSVTVYVKDPFSTKDYDDAQTLSIDVLGKPVISGYTSDKTELLSGQSAIFALQASGGSGKYLYRFVVLKDWNWVMTRPYSSDNTFTYTPQEPGNYEIYPYVEDASTSLTNDGMQNIKLTVYSKPQLSSVTAKGYMYEGKPVSLNASVQGGSPYDKSFRYQVYKGTALVADSTSSSENFTFTPSSAGVYTVKTFVKDSLSQDSYDSVKQFDITIQSKPLYLSSLPLYYGMRSSNVSALQTALKNLGYTSMSVTGYFGTQTKSYVISFQKSKGLSADGIVGNITYNALNEALIVKSGIKTLTY